MRKGILYMAVLGMAVVLTGCQARESGENESTSKTNVEMEKQQEITAEYDRGNQRDFPAGREQ